MFRYGYGFILDPTSLGKAPAFVGQPMFLMGHQAHLPTSRSQLNDICKVPFAMCRNIHTASADEDLDIFKGPFCQPRS